MTENTANEAMDPALIAHLGELSRIELPPELHAQLQADLTRIIELLGTLPKRTKADMSAEPAQGLAPPSFRQDVARPCANTDALLRLAPASGSGYYLVPQVIE